MNEAQQIILFVIVYAIALLGVLIYSIVQRRQYQRKQDLARIDGLCRIWKSMDQPRDERGRFKARA